MSLMNAAHDARQTLVEFGRKVEKDTLMLAADCLDEAYKKALVEFGRRGYSEEFLKAFGLGASTSAEALREMAKSVDERGQHGDDRPDPQEPVQPVD